ncbi:hypothetical protein [Bradyrhizobium sp. Arg816]|uniref:hypothetical protein n=1 Tax=Bradyrhizobium sp. Arg816 TaxID=2998491 RepID=UPI00249F7F5C|nr:hypothetical protein [Bradyrhizobium sp. Arg816]MDI3566843.1 hypothetical protein [Bradyrhizobium sp. Arg816]
MGWFKDNIRQGSWAALIALAINFALSFGHVHAFGGTGSGPSQIALTAPSAPDDRNHTPKHPADGVDYLCPICIASAAMGNALAPTLPALLVTLAEVSVDRAVEPAYAIPQPHRSAFQSRGPPIS